MKQQGLLLQAACFDDVRSRRACAHNQSIRHTACGHGARENSHVEQLSWGVPYVAVLWLLAPEV